MRWHRRGPGASGDLQAFIDEGSEIEGRYAFRGTVLLNGTFTGEIRSGDTLIVGDKGVVRATVHAGTVIVSGEVVGTVVATERIELRGRARVSGELEAPVVVMEEGVLFEGQCRMARPRPQGEEAPPRDAPAVLPFKRS